ncbi:MAG TPA: PAS domain S-box protein [Polyangiaceae bacterium]|nr:PAS domain S-box protein [Polyangiaceae bacterium]
MSQLSALIEGCVEGDHVTAQLIELARAIVLVLDPLGRIVFYNRYLEDLAGVPLHDTRGKEWFLSFIPDRDQDRIRALFHSSIAGTPVVEHVNPIRTRAGTEREIEWSATILRAAGGETLGVLCVGIDVTDRRRLEQRVRAQAQLVDEVSDAIISVDPEGRIETWNRAAQQIYGFSPEEALARNAAELVNSDYGQTTREEIMRELRTRGKWRGAAIHYGKDGLPRHIQSSFRAVYDAAGELRGIVGVNRDISNEVRAERRLRENERRYRAIFEQQHHLAGILSVDGTVLDINQRALQLAGVQREQVLGLPFWNTVWWSHSPELQACLRDAVRAAAQGQHVQFEAQHPRADGGMSTISFSLRPVLDEAGEVELLIPEGVDITERRKLEHQLTERERLAQIGTTASMFAHEIGNPLNAMALQGALLRQRLHKLQVPDGMIGPLDGLLEEIRRLSALLGDFRAFSRRQQLEFQPLDLSELVNEVVQLHVMQHQSARVRVEKSVPANLPKVAASRDKLKQVMLNLCKNALEAMPQGGVLRVTASYNDQFVTLLVSDTGVGIPDGLDVFQPFETTKADGTGLGLPIARQIARAHGGELVYESKVDQGTTFALKLPCSAHAQSAASGSGQPRSSSPS